MNNEIKEILNYLTKFINDKEEITKYGCEISVKQAKQLLDYITNLQEEKDYYFKKNNELSTLNTSLRNDRDIYKTRIDKVTKELEKLLPLCIMPNNTLIHATEKAKAIEKAINTLQGKSDE